MSNALVPYNEIEKMAVALGKGKLFGKTAEELLPLMLVAQSENKHPATVVQEYDLIQGKPALKSMAVLSRFQLAGGRIEWIERTDKIATAKFSHPAGGELTISWSMDRATQAQLTGKDNWKKYPAQMLSARVVAEGVRAVFPACLSGMYVTEEVMDFATPTRKDPTPIKAIEAEIVEQHTDDETANKLDACTTLDELSEAWKAIPVSNRRLYAEVKDSVKYRLMGQAEVANG